MIKTSSFFTGQIQCEVLTTLPLKFKDFYNNNQKSEMSGWWTNYSSNFRKKCDIVGPTTEEKIGSQKLCNMVLTTTQFFLIYC